MTSDPGGCFPCQTTSVSIAPGRSGYVVRFAHLERLDVDSRYCSQYGIGMGLYKGIRYACICSE
jgi:hypothetical protein